jgi:ankyrin repeat protein
MFIETEREFFAPPACAVLLMTSVYQPYFDLFRAVDDGDTIGVQVRLESSRRDVNERQRGITALYLAVRRENLAIVRLLLSHNADPNQICCDRTALFVATMRFSEEILAALLDAGANADILCTKTKVTCLHVAVAEGRTSICQLLLNAG